MSCGPQIGDSPLVVARADPGDEVESMSQRLRIAASTVCALVVVLACVTYGRHVQNEAERERAETLRRYGGETTTLVVANHTIEAGQVVGAADVSMRDWISSLAPEGAFLSTEDVVGREVSIPMAANMPLCELNFRNTSQIASIPDGHVAVCVPVSDKLGLSSAATVGSHVVAYRVKEGGAEPIGERATVLALPGATGTSAGKGSITVAVAANDVPAVLSASTSGDLRLVVPADDVREYAKSSSASNNVAAEPAKSKGDGAEAKDALAAKAEQGRAQDTQKEGE